MGPRPRREEGLAPGSGATRALRAAVLAVAAAGLAIGSGDAGARNRLAASSNPYLLLHADNPVEWYPWGEEAFARARAEGKPVFLSIGYSTCYWCHVAERTLYSDPGIAALMNRWFVNVKVDREQRPDLDALYMRARRLLTGSAGWPNNVFLTTDLEPFYAGSYFPPRDDPRLGPGFPRVLEQIHEAWENDRDRVLRLAARVAAAMRGEAVGEAAGPAAAAGAEPRRWAEVAGRRLVDLTDLEQGGVLPGPGGEKFPRAPALRLLWSRARTGDERARAAVLRTLDAIATGGLHDQLAGGFHRYSTTPDWSAPHFEKMLYDNAQLLGLYAEVARDTGDPLYRRAVSRAVRFLAEDLGDPRGGFYTAIDAQVDGVEGASYLWTEAGLAAALGADGAAALLEVLELVPMARPVAPGERVAEGGVLRVRADRVRGLDHRALVERLRAVEPRIERARAARRQRPQPLRDEKILVGLNGLAIAALARAGDALARPAWIDLASRAAGRLWRDARDPGDGSLAHEIYAGRARTQGFLEDYALLGHGLLALARASRDPRWTERATALAEALLARFARPDGSLVTSVAGDLPRLATPDDGGDGDYPAATSAAIGFLLAVGVQAARADLAAAGRRALAAIAPRVSADPARWPWLVASLAQTGAGAAGAASGGAEPIPAGGAPALPTTADHVRVLASLEAGARTGPTRVRIRVEVEPGFHVNANPASFDYLIPTRVVLDGPAPRSVRYPRAQRFAPAFAPEGLAVYEGTVEILVDLAEGFPSAGAAVRGEVEVQACDDRVCFPPARIPFEAR